MKSIKIKNYLFILKNIYLTKYFSIVFVFILYNYRTYYNQKKFLICIMYELLHLLLYHCTRKILYEIQCYEQNVYIFS
jgi:hypothetical protein